MISRHQKQQQEQQQKKTRNGSEIYKIDIFELRMKEYINLILISRKNK